MQILIKNIDEIYTMDNRIIKNGYIIIKDNKISEIGSTIYENNINYEKVIDARNMIALPGFINTHTHSAMTLLRGYADDLPLQEWLEGKIWPVEAKLTEEYIYWGAKLAIIEMLKSGTTTFTDMYFKMHKVGEAVKECGMRAVLSQGLIENNDGMDGLLAAKEFTEGWNGLAQGRISTLLAPHAPYTCSPNYLLEIIKAAEELNVGINIHLSETEEELAIIKENYDCSPVEYLEKVNLFALPTTAAHCVHVNEKDMQILKKYDVGVAHNPMSNMKLGSGVAPVAKMCDMGITVALGTDGVSSNNNLDMIEEARFASYLQKVSNNNPTDLDINMMAEMLTINGAKILDLKNLGKIKEGYLADIILIDIKNSPVYYPHYNNLSNLLYAGNGRDISAVIINGEIILEEGMIKTFDEEETYKKVEEITNKLL